jgi:GTP-binding protein
MVPATSPNIEAEYNILLHELEQYNPELLTKARILAVTKCDLPRVDENGEKLSAIKYKSLSKKLGIEVLPISSVAGEGIDELKDALWTELNKEQNQIIEISHAPIDITAIERSEPTIREENEDEQQTIYLNEVEEDWDLDKYKGIGWDE